jgi:AsmA protein
MKRILRVFAILAVTLAVIAGVLPFLIDADAFRPPLESRMTEAVGRDVKFGHLKLSLLTGSVVADDLSVAEDSAFGAGRAFVKAKSVRLRADLYALVFSHSLRVTAVEIEEPTVNLFQDEAGKWNFSSLGTTEKTTGRTSAAPHTSGTGGLDFSANDLTITDGRLTVGPKPYVFEKLNLQVKNFAIASTFPFSLEVNAFGGSLRVKGQAGPIVTTDASATPADATLAATGLDLAQIANDRDLGGRASLDATVTLGGHVAHLKAHLKADKLKLVKGGSPVAHAVELDCAVDHDLATQTGVLQQGDVHIGKAVASATGAYHLQDQSLVVKILVSGSDMPLADLAVLMPALNIRLPSGASIRNGHAAVRMEVEGDVDGLVSSGTVSATSVVLAGFDLGSKMSELERMASIRTGSDTAIQLFSTNLESGPRGARLDNLKLFVTGIGQISGSGTVSNGRQLDFRMRANLRASRRSTSGVSFSIRGTSADPVFRADERGVVVEERSPPPPTKLIKGLLGGRKDPK